MITPQKIKNATTKMSQIILKNNENVEQKFKFGKDINIIIFYF
jgi:hypothetical protein